MARYTIGSGFGIKIGSCYKNLIKVIQIGIWISKNFFKSIIGLNKKHNSRIYQIKYNK